MLVKCMQVLAKMFVKRLQNLANASKMHANPDKMLVKCIQILAKCLQVLAKC